MDTKSENQAGVDKGLVAVFLRMSPEERLQSNDNALRTILELRYAYRQRLPVLEETLRQVEENYGTELDSHKENGDR